MFDITGFYFIKCYYKITYLYRCVFNNRYGVLKVLIGSYTLIKSLHVESSVFSIKSVANLIYLASYPYT